MLDSYKELVPVLFGESGIKLAQYTFSNHELCFVTHWHDRVELLQVISGNLELHVDNKLFLVHPGEVAIIMPHSIHYGFSDSKELRYNVISFDVEKLYNQTTASSKYLIPIANGTTNFQIITNHPEITKLLMELVNYLLADNVNSLYATGITYQLIASLYQYCFISTQHVQKNNKSFGEILEYVNKHYTEDISAKNISQKFGYDESYFCRRFKLITGITLMKYIRILRLELAQKLLINSNESISGISWKCGFTDTHYFANCFKQLFGKTPTEYREMNFSDKNVRYK